MRARPRARSILGVGVGLVWTAVAVLLFIEGTVGLAVFFVILAVIQFAGAGMIDERGVDHGGPRFSSHGPNRPHWPAPCSDSWRDGSVRVVQ
jgi:hypothetical protein